MIKAMEWLSVQGMLAYREGLYIRSSISSAPPQIDVGNVRFRDFIDMDFQALRELNFSGESPATNEYVYLC